MKSSDRPLNGRACLITGASSGLGRSTASAMAAAGADVALVARSADELAGAADDAASENGVMTFTADLADADASRQVVQRTVGELGRLDVLVNAAGTDVAKQVVELEADG